MATVGLNRLDEEFLDKLNDYIMQHLDDGRLSVDVLATQMNMSASTFYRKVKATTSLAPNEMIRLCRLKKSAELLAEGYSISEVTDCVGFSTVPYFTSCFLKQFGITPGEFAKQSGKKPDTCVRRAAFHACAGSAARVRRRPDGWITPPALLSLSPGSPLRSRLPRGAARRPASACRPPAGRCLPW